MEKLTNLKTLELQNFHLNSLPPILNLSQLKLIDSTVSSLPTSLRHLEIIHKGKICKGCCGLCLNQLVNLEKLSVSCHHMKSLPTIAGLHNLQMLQLRDCFSLKTLPINMRGLVNLRTLNAMGTRIKSLPYSITKLNNLRHLILPKCFKWEDLPSYLREGSIAFTLDDTDELYYEEMGYYDSEYETSTETSDQHNALSEGIVREGVNGEDLRGSRHGIIDEQRPPHLPIAAAPVLEASHFTGREDPGNTAFCSTQNPEKEILPSGNCTWTDPRVPSGSSSSHETESSGRSSQNALQVAMCFMSSVNERGEALSDQHISPCDTRNLLGSENNYHAFGSGQIDENMQRESDNAKSKGKKTKITQEAIENLFSRKITLVAGAKVLGVSRSTLKRRLQDFQIKWPSSRYGNKKKQITKSPSSGNVSLVNLVNTTALSGHEQSMEGFDVANQQILSDHIPFQCNDINNLTQNGIVETVEVLTVATQAYTDGHKHCQEYLNGASHSTLSNTIEECGTSYNFVMKATYKDDTVRFDFSSGSVDELKKEVANNLDLELGKFKIRYQDDDKEWMLMTKNKHLECALNLSKSSGSNILRLLIIDV